MRPSADRAHVADRRRPRVVPARRRAAYVDGQVKAAAGDIVVVPAGTAHRFANTGSERLQLVAIHRSAEFVTDWLE